MGHYDRKNLELILRDSVTPREPMVVTFSDWKRHVNRKPLKRPDVPTPANWTAMSPEEQQLSKQRRSLYNAGFQPVLTASRRKIFNAIMRLVSVNRKSADNARIGCAIQGIATVGKTTLVQYIGREVDKTCRDILQQETGQSERVPDSKAVFIPVVYITMRGQKNRDKVSFSAFIKKLARFYELPISSDEDNLIEAIIDVARKARTTLIIIDEMSNLDTRFVGSKPIIDMIKDLMNCIPATFVFVGTADKMQQLFAGYDAENLEEIEVPHDTNSKKLRPKKAVKPSSQMAHRLIDYDMLPFNAANHLQQEAEEIVDVIDEEIALVNHKVGTLKNLAPYIIARTNGYIGAIVLLIRLACEAAIFEGGEKITKRLLESIDISQAAETHAKRNGK
jgi:AAA domain